MFQSALIAALQQNFLRIRIFLGSLKINHQILYSYGTLHRMHAHECHIESCWRQVKPWNMYAYIIWHYKCMEFHSFIWLPWLYKHGHSILSRCMGGLLLSFGCNGYHILKRLVALHVVCKWRGWIFSGFGLASMLPKLFFALFSNSVPVFMGHSHPLLSNSTTSGSSNSACNPTYLLNCLLLLLWCQSVLGVVSKGWMPGK